jgi:UDP-glucose 4-epimerase
MNKILITGAAGFIGLKLAEKLISNKNKLYLVDNLSRGKFDNSFKKILKNKNVKFLKKDLTKKLFFKDKFDYIFHLASVVGVKNVNQDPMKTFNNNILSTLNLIRSIKNKKKTKLVFFSTSEVYAASSKRDKIFKPSEENSDLLILKDAEPRDSYFLSKLICEKVVSLSGCKFIILRPHNIYGPRMGHSHVIPELLQKIKKNYNCKIYSPDHTRSFCFVDDAIEQIIKLSFSNKLFNSIYNIGNMKEEIKIINLAKKIKAIVNKNCKLIRYKITPGSPKRRVPNMKKTVNKIKITNFTSLNNGLIQTSKWYLNEKN